MKAKDKNYDALLQEMRKVWGRDQSMVDYCMKETSQCVMLSDGKMMVKFEQPRIEKDFCFGYSTCGQGQEYDEARKAERDCNDHLEEYFMAHNRRSANYDNDIEALQDSDRKLYLCVRYTHGKLLMDYLCIEPCRVELEPWRYKDYVLSAHQEEDKALLIDAIRMEQQKHEKRLRQWWKRYGAEKCRTWTYWVDE